MLLSDDVESMILERQLDPQTEAQYRRAVRDYGLYLGRQASRSDLEERRVNEFLRSLEPTKGPHTIRLRKRGITAVWNWLCERDLAAPYRSIRLRKIKIPEKPPVAWSMEDVRILLTACDQLTMRLKCGIEARRLMRAWIFFAYETGLRPIDIRGLRRSQIIGNQVFITQHKTGHPHICTVSNSTLRELEYLQRDDCDHVFGLPKSTIRNYELKLFTEAGKLGFVRQKGQSTGVLRKTHATEVCRTQGIEAAARSIGHKNGTEIAKKHYVQPDAIARPLPPPALNHGSKPSTDGARAHSEALARRTEACGRSAG